LEQEKKYYLLSSSSCLETNEMVWTKTSQLFPIKCTFSLFHYCEPIDNYCSTRNKSWLKRS